MSDEPFAGSLSSGAIAGQVIATHDREGSLLNTSVNCTDNITPISDIVFANAEPAPVLLMKMILRLIKIGRGIMARIMGEEAEEEFFRQVLVGIMNEELIKELGGEFIKKSVEEFAGEYTEEVVKEIAKAITKEIAKEVTREWLIMTKSG
ncbi:hypothetical protein [Endozoicomonas sp. 8E]|uniref:hypothetical protein n=1 Tax=Endozoicomonas sp. 8E TaxID=3035692 RepID=UPI002938FFBF|nr:hypothetical protein [Endozoicomonas sp. 8E]WOG28486.1 hypothetical protein P6910_02185 [Endozoicomonas sp. 8E]